MMIMLITMTRWPDNRWSTGIWFFCSKKKYTPVNLLSGDAEKCCTRQKVFPVDITSGAFVTEGVRV